MLLHHEQAKTAALESQSIDELPIRGNSPGHTGGWVKLSGLSVTRQCQALAHVGKNDFAFR